MHFFLLPCNGYLFSLKVRYLVKSLLLPQEIHTFSNNFHVTLKVQTLFFMFIIKQVSLSAVRGSDLERTASHHILWTGGCSLYWGKLAEFRMQSYSTLRMCDEIDKRKTIKYFWKFLFGRVSVILCDYMMQMSRSNLCWFSQNDYFFSISVLQDFTELNVWHVY